MSNTNLLTTLPYLVLILLSVLGDVSHAALTDPPLNVAATLGSTVRLQCRVADPPPQSRVMWGEFISNSAGNIISDNYDIIDHPNRDRYQIHSESAEQFDLEIRDVGYQDGGRYVCQDTLAGPPAVFRGEAELIVMEPAPNCTTTQPADGIVIEGQNQTVECIIHYFGRFSPHMTWTGPPPFTPGHSPANPTTVWSGVHYTVDRSMDTRAFQCLTNFTEIPDDLPLDAAHNIPEWNHLFRAGQMFVHWGPKNLYADPMLPAYVVGDIIRCYSDAFPVAQYNWQNMRTLEITNGQTFTVSQNMVGFNQTLRCQAQNNINGFIYTDNLFIAADVPAPTTTPTTTTPAPTTTLPAQGPCKDITGSWVSKDPYAELYVEVNHDSEIGEIVGIMKNLTDTVWVEVVGTVRFGDFFYLGLTAIWPFEDGITGMAGECHSCHGVDVIMTHSLWRSIAASSKCGDGSTPEPDVEYHFYRVGSAATFKEKEYDIIHPTKEVSGSLGLKLKKR